ncbi:hypothetical protein SLE2022_361000 [Rubroshorea leprosula]
MLHSLPLPEMWTFNGTDMTVFERQQARMEWLQQQNHVVELSSNPVSQFQGFISSSFHADGVEFGASNMGFVVPEAAVDHSGSWSSGSTAAAMETVTMKAEGEDVVLMEKMESKANKRKAETAAEEKGKQKRNRGEGGLGSDIKANCSAEISASTSSKENSKASNVQKPDYIHVRARRGQATDSHSLAERARREKISRKMKCLQDLVPGCNKVTGKAGMLDEIINYVQSLQRQVEFLSMKLATLNPSLEFNIDNFPAKEFPAYIPNFPAAAKLPAMTNLASLQFFLAQQGSTSCMLEVPMHTPQAEIGGNSSSSLSIPQQALNSSCVPQLQSFSTWNADSQGLHSECNMGFQ